jgi:DNA-binding LacI/PurR family transcriptional regulator
MASLVSPALTTNHVHRKLLGAQGIRALLRRINHPKQPTTALTIDTTFIVRDSTKPNQIFKEL